MKGHDVRRTGQSLTNGPSSIDSAATWIAQAAGAHTLNVGATVTESGVFVSSWGLLRNDHPNPDPRFWDKSDGKVFGFDPATGDALWGGPLKLDLVPRCYDFEARGPNLAWCGFTQYQVTHYNGTVEGQAAVDTSRGVMYVGRGDGKLYAIDPVAGEIRWRFVTFNPQKPDDPDGGGEIISSPLLAPDGTVYFGTWGEGEYETEAVYAVNPDSTLLWRYPADSSLVHRIYASPALSADGSTLYVSSFRDDVGNTPGTLYAFNTQVAGPSTDAARLKWAMPLENGSTPVQSATLAVGTDGTIYVGGLQTEGFGVAIIGAVVDQGDHASLKWSTPFVALRDGAQFVHGIALRETGGQTRRLYATTSNTSLFNANESGSLFAIDPSTGEVLASYDPSTDVDVAVGGLNSPAIGANGTIYFGVRGRFGDDGVNGHYFAVSYDSVASSFARLWHYEVDGYVEWSHPAIGPDGGLYGASSSFDQEVRLATHSPDATPPNTSPFFYAFKGPDNPVGVDAPRVSVEDVSLEAPFPNPFSSDATLVVNTTRAGTLHIGVYDLLGRNVRTLAESPHAPGRYAFRWDGTGDDGRPLAAGVYLVRVQLYAARGESPSTRSTQMLVLSR